MTEKFLPFFTLFRKEILRFLASPAQTLFAPVITSTLFLFVFGVNLGSQIPTFGTLTYLQFVAPGLTLMGVITSSFAHTSSSLFFSRYIGNIVDLLVTPLTAPQMILAYTFAAMLRGLVVGFMVLLVASVFTDLVWYSPLAILAMAALTSFLLSQLGLIAALFSDTFEAVSMYSNFLLLPLVYFGGMFYPIATLPPFWRTVSHFNPLFYCIDGFRGAFYGVSDNPLSYDFAMASFSSLILFCAVGWIFAKGRRLRV